MFRKLRDPVVDEAFDAYLRWRDACAAVHRAYERWRGAARPEAEAGFCAYRAALEREEDAAFRYARLVLQVPSAASRAAAPGLPVL